MSAQPFYLKKSRKPVARFLGGIILMLVAAPFLDEYEYGLEIDAMLITAVLVLGLLAVSRSRRTFLIGVALLLPAIITRWLFHFQPHWLPVPMPNISALIFMVFVEWQLLRFIFRARHVDSEVLCAGIAGYLLLGVLWMSAYILVSRLNPIDATHLGAFAFNVNSAVAHPLSQFEAYYFSFITLSTVGYGDITPLSHGARTLAMLEAMTGTLYLAVLISRLVSLHSTHSPPPAEGQD